MNVLPPGLTWRDGGLAVLLGVASAAAFPPLGIWPLALIGSAALLWLLREQAPANALNLGLIYGFVYGMGTIWWMVRIFGQPFILLLGLFAAYFGLLAFGIAWTKGYSPLVRAALIGMLAVGIEWLRGDAWYLRFPWYTAPHALAQWPPLIAPVRWLGAYGYSFLIWFIAGLGVTWRPWVWAAFLLLPGCSLFLPAFDPPNQRALLVQTEKRFGVEELMVDVQPGRIDLAVLPEYAYPVHYEKALASQAGPLVQAKRLHCPVVFGAIDGEPGTHDFQNVAVVLDADGSLLGLFPKQRPVPLLRDGRAGSERPIFPVRSGVLGVAICYDFDAPEVSATLTQAGATVLVAPNYDALYWGRIQHLHHALLFRLRAVENDRWLVKAASSGRSEAIDPHGQPSVEGVEIGESGTVTVGFGHRHTWTLGRFTYWLGPASALGMLVFGVVTFVQNRRRERTLPTEEPNPFAE